MNMTDSDEGGVARRLNDAARAINEIERLLQSTIDEIEGLLQSDDESPYGYCPHCGSKGVQRERRPDGNDTCEQNHVYPSRDAVLR